MQFSRRKFIKIAGSSAIIVAASSCASRTESSSATLPWTQAGAETEMMRFGFAHALLAPNPHNRQPWIVALHDPMNATLYVDTDKDLPETDPFDRQITIGLGCFLELFSLAIATKGYVANIELFPQGSSEQGLDKRPIAQISLIAAQDLPTDPLFAQIYARRTNRNEFTKTVPSQKLLQQITQTGGDVTVGFTIDKQKLEALRTLSVEAARIEFLTPHTYMESVELMRIGNKEIAQNPDVLAIRGPMMGLLKKAGIVTRTTLADTNSSAFKQGLKQYSKAAASASAFVWIATPNNSREEQIQAGRTYVRQNLMATKMGLAMHPLSQALQEYPEMKEKLIKAHELTKTTGQRLQILARVGYAKEVPPAPRFPLTAKLAIDGQNNTN